MSSEPFIERKYDQKLLSMQESAQSYCLVCITIRDFVLKFIFCSKINLLLARNDHLKAHLYQAKAFSIWVYYGFFVEFRKTWKRYLAALWKSLTRKECQYTEAKCMYKTKNSNICFCKLVYIWTTKLIQGCKIT